MNNTYLLGARIAALILVVAIIAIIAPKIRSKQRRKALEQIVERYHQSGQALVRYVMLNRQCSEEAAYQRLAAFVKKYISLDDTSDIDWLLRYDRQSLIDKAQNILIDNPDEIEKI